ncbi:hypothetical protein CC2G_002130 [Coprinopsis cinerea AmutBmut pab1-1]|nr:hypothetical protein CC2G_002130 [Coprinopsis cinerea AmutBmut pab1-1]
MSDDPAAYQQFLETLATQATAVNLVAASCLTLLIYNHLLTLDQEITQFWPTRWTLAKVLFLANRYIVEGMLLFNCISRQFVRGPYSNFQPPLLIHASIQLYFLTSLAHDFLYNDYSNCSRNPSLDHKENRVILSIGCFFYFGGVVTLIGLVIQDYVGEDVLIDNTLSKLPLPGCYATSVPAIIAGFWIAPLIVETVLVGLVVARAWLWKRRGMSVPPLLAGLARDSTIYYIVVFAFLFANYMVFQFGPPFLSSLMVAPSTTAGCILGSHMLLNLRKMDRSNHPTESQQQGIALSNWRNQAIHHTDMPNSDPSTSQSDPYFPGGPRVDVKFSTDT